MFSKIITCLSIFGLLSNTLTTEQHSHEGTFLGEYSNNVLRMKPEDVEEFLYWLVEQRIDQNHDMKISLDELKHWMERVYHTDLDNEIMRQFMECNPKKDHTLTFKEYRACIMSRADYTAPTVKSENRLVARWRLADSDGDSRLSMTEFGPFLYPAESHHQLMHGLLTDEYMEDKDRNEDKLLTMEEFIAVREEEEQEELNKEEVEEKEEEFTKIDENKDGTLSHPELEVFLFPYDDDPTHDEATHLMEDADDDKDERITHAEMMKHLKLFVGSRVLHSGKVFLKDRDEL